MGTLNGRVRKLGDINFNIEYNRKMKLIDSLKSEIAILVEKREYLVKDKKPFLESKYMMTIGKHEKERLEIEIEVRALKRELSIRRAALNRGEKVTSEEIKEVLKKELRLWQNKINEYANQIKKSELFLKLPRMDVEETKEFKSLYKKLVKRLHPDLNEFNEKSKFLWLRTCAAYKDGDLDELRTLICIVQNEEEDENYLEKNLLLIDDKIDELQQIFHNINNQIEELHSTFPFTIEKEISSIIWIKNKVDEILENVNMLKNHREKLQVVLSEFL